MSHKSPKEYEIAKAVAELHQATKFFEEIVQLPSQEMVEKVAHRDPAFIDHIEAMKEPPKDASEFWEGFSIWTIRRLCDKYRDIWSEVIDAWFQSPLRKQLQQKFRVESQIEEILRNVGFD